MAARYFITFRAADMIARTFSTGGSMRKLVVLLLLVSFVAVAASAQLKLPQASPSGSISQEVGISKVTINYNRPYAKGRQIFGGLVPYGQIWRLGANAATTIELSHPAKIAGKEIAAGKYALFATPTETEWTFTINSVSDQWGTYYRDPAKDVLTFTAKPAANPMTESLTIDLRPVSETSIEVATAWERVRVPFNVEFDTAALTWKSIDEQILAKPEDATILAQAARFAADRKMRLDDAMKWVDKSIALKETYSNTEVKARVLRAQGKTAEAVKQLDRAMQLAEGKTPVDYTNMLKATRAEWTK